jgi:fructose 1,6-bisphosphate aldolase/phosphatase
MKLTPSIIKADIGAIGGHIQPSARLLESVRSYVQEYSGDLLIDNYISSTGDDIAIVNSHRRGAGQDLLRKENLENPDKDFGIRV